MISADALKAPFFSATRCSADSVPAYKSFLHRTRFLLLLLVILLNAIVYSNTILFNFALICMSEGSLENVLNGTKNDYELLREAVAASMNDFRSSWFTFSGFQRSIIFTMAPLGSLIAISPTWFFIMKFGYRRVCSVTCLISTLLCAFLPWSIFYGFPFVATTQFLLGAMAPSALLLVPSVIRKWSTRKNDHFCFLVLSTFQQISPTFLYPIAAYISKSFFGWPVVFYFQSIISFLATIAFFYFYKETPIRHANVSSNELERIQRDESVRGNIDYKKMILCRQYQSVSLCIFSYFLLVSFFVQYLPTYLFNIMDQSLEKSAWTISLIMTVHLILKVFISRIFEKNPLLTTIYSIKFMCFASLTGSALIMITLFLIKFLFEIQLIFYTAIAAFLSLSWPSVFKSSNIISNKYYLPVMVRTQIVLFYFASVMSNILPLIFGRRDNWESWRFIWLGMSILLIGTVIFFWTSFKFDKSDWDVVIPEPPPEPVKPEEIAPVSHIRPCTYSTTFDNEIVVSIISRGLERCDTCKKLGIDSKIHPKTENDLIRTRRQLDQLLQEKEEARVSITRF
ncbi:hypothetical protein B9Z55_028636 [Caenorhabditis nigoni]|uniref:Major facilitator superfamily (MFS) profile domain-containing protein n=2 Tax=Caenorhabditis nigoni TaxID=1611254 RepID=A0A2G5SAZ0_9PELO|nr:hypothetical protein B9Z55_028636 [Caenorhabditis nigoni]